MAKYHISIHGEPVRCPAQQKCRVKTAGGEHFEGTLREAVDWAEKKNAEEAGGNLSSATKESNPAYDSSVKEKASILREPEPDLYNAYDAQNRQKTKDKLHEATQAYHYDGEDLDEEIVTTAFSAINHTSHGELDDVTEYSIAQNATNMYYDDTSGNKVDATRKAVDYAVEETASIVESNRSRAAGDAVKDNLDDDYTSLSPDTFETSKRSDYQKEVNNMATGESGGNNITIEEKRHVEDNKPYWTVTSTITRDKAGVVHTESKKVDNLENVEGVTQEYVAKQNSFVYEGNKGDDVISSNDLEDISNSEEFEGWGYFGERSRAEINTDPEVNTQKNIPFADHAVIRNANKEGLTKDELFEWGNSKAGRWYGDLAIGGDGADPKAKNNDYAYAQALLPKKGEDAEATLKRSAEDHRTLRRKSRRQQG